MQSPISSGSLRLQVGAERGAAMVFRSPDPAERDDPITRFYGIPPFANSGKDGPPVRKIKASRGLYSVPLLRLNKPFTFVKN